MPLPFSPQLPKPTSLTLLIVTQYSTYFPPKSATPSVHMTTLILQLTLCAVEWAQLSVTRGSNASDVTFTEHASGWDAARQRVVVFNRDGLTYALDASKTWYQVATTNSPPARFSTVYGSDNVGLVICSGEDSSKEFYNDVWRFTYATDTWEELATLDASGAPETRYGAVGGVHGDPSSGYHLLITHGFASKRYSNAFRFDLSLRVWEEIESGSHEYSMTHPHARCLMPGTVNPSGEIFMFGGCLSGGGTGGPCPSWDGWCRNTEGDWHRITDGSNPTPRTRGLMVTFPPQPHRTLLITSGTVKTGAQWLEGSEAVGGDIGLVDCNERHWRFKRPSGTSPPRLHDASVTSNSTHIILTGGNADGVTGVNTYVLTWTSTYFDDAEDASGTESYLTLVIMHGVFMFLAWGILCPVGMFCARYLKERDPLWFKVHRAMMCAGLLCTVIGFGLIVPAILGSGHFKFAHGAIGLVVVILALLQPVNAVLRPHKPSPGEERSVGRLIWEILHRWSGRTAVLLGLINCILGVLIAVAPMSVVVTCIVWCSVIFILGVVLEMIFRSRFGFCKNWKAVIEAQNQTDKEKEATAPASSPSGDYHGPETERHPKQQ